MNMPLLEHAVACHQRGELVQAEQLYSQVLQSEPQQFDALHMLGVIRLGQGRHEEALQLIGDALKANPESARAHANYARALVAANRHEEALASFNRALAIKRDYPEALRGRGSVFLHMGRYAEAITSCDEALGLRPDYTDALVDGGNAMAALKIYPEALACFNQALTIDRNYAEAWQSRGNVLLELKRHQEALTSFDRALAVRPDFAEAFYGRGQVLQALARHSEALSSYDRALALKPDFAEALNNRGTVLREVKQHQDALASYDRALALRPNFAEALNNRGNVLNALDRHEEALASYDRALALKPDFAEAHYNRGDALARLERHTEALASYDRALALNPDYADAINNRGTALQALGRFDEALASFERAVAVAPDHAKAHWNIAADRLSVCDFARGWKEYEWRRAVPEYNLKAPPFAQPVWNGEHVAGGLLVWAEQGLGDEILYAGMVPDLAGRAETVILEVDPRLVPLFRRSFPGVTVTGRGTARNETGIKAQIGMASLGPFLRPTLKSFPYREHGYLSADAEKTASLRARLAPQGERIVGLSWISKNPLLGKLKTARLRDFESLLRIPGCRFVDLQYGDTSTERRALEEEAGLRVERLDDIDNTNDLDGLAALVSACDAVVTVSNTTAHLAGALGRPTWVFAPHGYARFWYWFRDRADSPWYPHLRIVRQAGKQPWGETVAVAAGELAAFLKTPKGEAD